MTLSLSFVDTTIESAQANAVHFTVGGLAADDNGAVTFSDGVHTATVGIAGGAAVSPTVDLSGFNDGTVTATLSASDAAGNLFTATSSNAAVLDRDATETASLSFVDTTIQTAQANAVHFTVGGLAADDNGAVTFSDGVHTATVGIAGGAAVSPTVDLSGFNDGTVTATLSASDAAGNLITATSSNAAVLDQDATETASLSFVDTTIQTAHANAVHFAVGGLDAEDSAVVTFTDHLGGSTTKTVSANGTTTVDLSGLADGTITASMQVATDPAGNSFTPVAASNQATLDQDATETASLSFVDTTIQTAQANAVHFAVGGL